MALPYLMRIALSLLFSLAFIIAQAQTQISVVSNSDTLYGTLVSPPKATTVVLIIPGSGPTDRNGNNTFGLNPNSYQMLAQALHAEGIASLRYDKRGVAQSATSSQKEENLRIVTYVEDALIWQDSLSKRYKKVVVLGHSEGALIGTLAAQAKPIFAFIALAGAGLPADSVIKEQLSKQNPMVLAMAAPFIDSLKQGMLVKAPAMLNALLRPSVQPYIISWFAYDPAQELAKLSCPVLIIGGTSDIQVPPAYAERLAQHSPQAQLVVINGLTHTLKQAAEGNAQEIMDTYSQPNTPLHPQLAKTIINFIKNL